jgi:uncharacterized protein YndB with AHSA1/START domain
MEQSKQQVTVKNSINLPAARVWELWSSPEHITQWNAASDDWHSPRAENDLRTGGKFTTRMEAKDGSFGFDFGGTYTNVVPNKLIAYTLGDDRKVTVSFETAGESTIVEVTFETETQNPVDMQRAGWQAIHDNFKKYAESL